MDEPNEIDCPACGCNESSVLRSADTSARSWKAGAVVAQFTRRRVRRRCGNCGHCWTSTTQTPTAAPKQ